jgi:hypothetical protein
MANRTIVATALITAGLAGSAAMQSTKDAAKAQANTILNQLQSSPSAPLGNTVAATAPVIGVPVTAAVPVAVVGGATVIGALRFLSSPTVRSDCSGKPGHEHCTFKGSFTVLNNSKADATVDLSPQVHTVRGLPMKLSIKPATVLIRFRSHTARGVPHYLVLDQPGQQARAPQDERLHPCRWADRCQSDANDVACCRPG